MDTNSHQKVPTSQAVANSQPRQAALPRRALCCKASTSMASEAICNQPLGWPGVVPGRLQP